jgi:S-adenosylmethionine synthetase
MLDIQIHTLPQIPTEDQPVEYVERKGLGHPDSICDAVMDAAATALAQAYLQQVGCVLHHNLDKALLVAGESRPQLGGGQVVSPLQIVAGDRATRRYGQQEINVDEIVEATVQNWFRGQMRFVDPDQHVLFQSEIKQGSAELVGIFDRPDLVANDTSAAVGYAPLTETERLVLEAEAFLNSNAFKEQFPCCGEDIKVMGVRHGRDVGLTLAIAFVDRFVSSVRAYFELKHEITDRLVRHLTSRLVRLNLVGVEVNVLDDESRGVDGTYLTVLGTSAECGDGGEVGRGNGVNGLISLNRPTGNEAAAGKNAACHVGKIYSYLSHDIAAEIATLDALREVTVWLCSQIGRPIDQPWSIAASVVLRSDATLNDVKDSMQEIVCRQIANVQQLTNSLIRGERRVC